ncbi:MAG TPA: MFS transporter [Nocardioides sp.]|uniref:MFS transporter n=1 Tax=Nocardioides sp. TaxID=35761 RepID=UPI002C45A2F3|nr:MFS transporter [Nocardioides sp.]HTW17791.1 MFS transporter [Nocardioides sp.]
MNRNRPWALAVLATTQLMVILDGTIVNVALPAIRRDLGYSDAGLAWVVNGFFVAFAVLLLPAGRLGDLIGPRRVFLSGVALFTLASVACGLAWSPATLVGARVLQGAGGALSTAVVLGLIARLYDDPAARGRAFGMLAFVGAAGASVGVVAGGVLTELAGWRWVFLVNAPFGLAVLLAGLRFVEEYPGPGLRAGLAARVPLVPRRVLADRRFLIANAVLFTMTVAGFSFQFLSGLYLQDVLGYPPLRTGLSYLTVTAAIAISSLLVSSRLAERYGAERVLTGGLVAFVAGLAVLARFPEGGHYWIDVAPALFVAGTGFGLAMPQVTGIAMAAAGAGDTGAASGLVSTTQQLGGAVGLAVVAAVAAATGHSAGLLLATAVLAVGTVASTYLVARRPHTGPLPAEALPAPSLERC